jgi:hypothetical protein
METAEYWVRKISRDFAIQGESSVWRETPALYIRNFLWVDAGSKPEADVKLCYSSRYLYASFMVYERKIRIQYTGFQDPVYKDSCVEFFIDPFPEKKLGYINIETNAIGAMLIAFGKDRNNRRPISKKDLAGFQIVTSVRKLINGFHGSEFWTLKYRLPLKLFKKYYGEKVSSGLEARANFYKCGDETEFPHYGAWSPIQSSSPDFHRPEFFGRLIFD